MVEEILPNLYRIEIPLPKNPLKSLNSYLVRGGERFLIIDTGMNREECMNEMSSSLARLSVDMNKTDFFITHLHVDHIGLVGDLATDTSRVYFNGREAAVASPEGSEGHLRQIAELYKSHGFAAEELERAAASHPAHLYGLRQRIDFCLLKEGDTLDFGDYSLSCIETPGHSPNHVCLYEANKKVLISGDHILCDITPNITLWPEMENPLKEYLASLDKVYALDVNLVLPGHRNLWNNHRRRIRELQEHHQARLQEVVSALEDGEKTAFDVAPWVSWDIDCDSWERFPPSQKWFALGETLAHLKYLEENGIVQRKAKGQKIVFLLA